MQNFMSKDETLVYRALLAMAMILVAAALRIAPHPWNFTPVGAMAIFSGATLRDKRLAFAFPLLALFAGDCFLGFHALIPVVYVSFLVNVAIGFSIEKHRTARWVAAAALAGAIQFFVITNFGVWAHGSLYPRTAAGLMSCYAAGIPFFWNTLAGDAIYTVALFGGFALAERYWPVLRETPRFRGSGPEAA